VTLFGSYRFSLLDFDPMVIDIGALAEAQTEPTGPGSGDGSGTGPGSGPGTPIVPPPDGSGVLVERIDVMHEALAAVAVSLASWVALTFEYRGLIGRSNLEPNYSRHQVLGGARLTFGWSPPAQPSPASPAEGAAGRLVVELDDQEATQVAVVGTFNGWNAREGQLTRRGGRWVGSFEVPPGQHQYMLSIDGEVRPPPDCQEWVPDGFGGRNCVFGVE
jgi:hypothetical protein